MLGRGFSRSAGNTPRLWLWLWLLLWLWLWLLLWLLLWLWLWLKPFSRLREKGWDEGELLALGFWLRSSLSASLFLRASRLTPLLQMRPLAGLQMPTYSTQRKTPLLLAAGFWV
ncbi:hypothetical protein AXG53_18220 [Stenotrophomonas sp. KCTC 12332]|nr:hypothetical protein AXG53_18220 [Stenotrophomonas sp. KCTC 12332]